MCDITERAHRVTINNKYVIVCSNNKDYMSVGIAICIFSNVSDSIFYYAFAIFIYLITRQTRVTVRMIPPSVNLLNSRFEKT